MINVGIVGATGYTGAELLRLLVNHPEVNIKMITSRGDAGVPVSNMYPNLRQYCDLEFVSPDSNSLSSCDVVFFATPHGVAHSMVAPLFEKGVKIIDLSADFRLQDADLWAKWYGQAHGCPDLLPHAVYGLPEMHREKIRQAQLIACPGCYPTATLLGLLPLIKHDLVNPESIIANAASGVSGAGRQAKVANLYTEVSDSFKAYAASGHRHLPEILQGLHTAQPKDASPANITFVPHLLPMIRGMHISLYTTLKNPSEDVQSVYEAFYQSEQFVDVLPQGSHPETRSVKASNMCRIAMTQPQDGDTLVVFSVIDNLTKGASGQAVQNMNIMFGLEEKAGLEQVAIIP